jgi:hypothetical protein
MAKPGEGHRSSGGYIVLREVEDGHWYVVGDVDRRPRRSPELTAARTTGSWPVPW